MRRVVNAMGVVFAAFILLWVCSILVLALVWVARVVFG